MFFFFLHNILDGENEWGRNKRFLPKDFVFRIDQNKGRLTGCRNDQVSK